MRTILNYITEQNDDELIALIHEALNNDVSESEIEESFDRIYEDGEDGDKKSILAQIQKKTFNSLRMLAGIAKVKPDQLEAIIKKICGDNVEKGVIGGISVMLCGALLAIKENGKRDNSSIKKIFDKLAHVMNVSKKPINKILGAERLV